MVDGKVVLDRALLFDAEYAVEFSADNAIGDVVTEDA
jgi:hypothetical protein